jgi:hypothetical protein
MRQLDRLRPDGFLRRIFDLNPHQDPAPRGQTLQKSHTTWRR